MKRGLAVAAEGSIVRAMGQAWIRASIAAAAVASIASLVVSMAMGQGWLAAGLGAIGSPIGTILAIVILTRIGKTRLVEPDSVETYRSAATSESGA